MSAAITPVSHIDINQWNPEEYDLLFHLANFARMANAVEVEPGPLQGWFKEALWRHYSYAPFNCRVMENYFSLAFFYGYNAPWNPYYRDAEVLKRLELTLEYTFARMAENGAIPEYAPAELDTPMLAPSSFGMEYMSAALEAAGPVLPEPLKSRLCEYARKAAVYVLTSDESWEHARSYTNQFLGAMAGGARLARLTDDDELMDMVTAAGDALVQDFISPMGFLYEADGPETFSYFFVSLKRLAPLYEEWPDKRVLEAFTRHCEWMSRWMLTEPDSDHILLSASHQTRTASKGAYLVDPGRLGVGHARSFLGSQQAAQKGASSLVEAAGHLADPLRLMLLSQEKIESYQNAIAANPQQALAQVLEDTRSLGYPPVSTESACPIYAPTTDELARARASLPCNNPNGQAELFDDDRGNQYVFYNGARYTTAFAFGQKRTAAQYGPAHLWTPDAGTIILAHNGEGPAWETRLMNSELGTGKALANAETREGRGGIELWLHYSELGFGKAYIVRPDGIDVQIQGQASSDGRMLLECIPLLLRATDELVMDYGRCRAESMSERLLGIVTRYLTIERRGKAVLTIDMGEPISMSLTPTYDKEGFVRCLLQAPLAPHFYFRTGYRVIVR